jgi:hypothetical protein
MRSRRPAPAGPRVRSHFSTVLLALHKARARHPDSWSLGPPHLWAATYAAAAVLANSAASVSEAPEAIFAARAPTKQSPAP